MKGEIAGCARGRGTRSQRIETPARRFLRGPFRTRSLRDAILGGARSAPPWPLRGRAEPVFAMVQRPRRGRAVGPDGLANGLDRPGGEDEGVGRDGARLAGLSSARGWSSVPRTGKSPTRFRSSASFSVVPVHSDSAPLASRPDDATDKIDEVGLFPLGAFGEPVTSSSSRRRRASPSCRSSSGS